MHRVNQPSPAGPSPTSIAEPLVDRFGRVHTNLRLSVTDRCNIRCFYCMPTERVTFRSRKELLTFEEIGRFVRAARAVGIGKLRITGGEPLVRAGLAKLVQMVSSIPGIEDVALTTNGLLLAEQAEELRAAGLKRVNISLDTLSEETFCRITRRCGLEQVLEGIFAAQRVGFDAIKLNAVAIRELTEVEIVPLGRFARQHDLELRFIEFMPLNATGQWNDEDVLTGGTIRARLEAEFGPLLPVERLDRSQPAVDFRFADGLGRIGFINPVSQPFCEDCNRLRLTAEGKLRNCLFSTVEWDARAILRGGKSDSQLQQLMRDCVTAKHPSHGIGSKDFEKPDRAMHEIGG